jgi:photosystem II stability/assembly factor-like uncharacterized protein
MSRLLVCLSLGLLAVWTVPASRAAGPRHFEDATLRAIQMVDDKEGWAVGDEGVTWHTIDGGQSWERQPTGLSASLRSLCFLNPYVGWVAGREELPQGGSAGVLLWTQDGGCKWRRLLEGSLPGLNRVRFSDAQHGFLLGDGNDRTPTGIFKTSDGGQTWNPVPGRHSPGWLDGDFIEVETKVRTKADALTGCQIGVLTGAWGRLAYLREHQLTAAEVDALSGRSVFSVRLTKNGGALAVGQGGLVLVSRSQGVRWGFVNLKLPEEVLAAWDFNALEVVGSHAWAVGRPGSALLHSADDGKTWEVLKTGQPLPLHGVYFLDQKRGWAVGELGCILHTIDGGVTWKVQQGGGQRAAVLFVHAQPTGLPVETVALVGGEEGYLTAGLWVAGPDPKSAAPPLAASDRRFAAAMRDAGGTSAELLWQFPLPQHVAGTDRKELLQSWNQIHGDKAADQLLRQLVLALRTWRPDVVVTDHPDAQVSGSAAGALVAEALHQAFSQAVDAQAFPEQIQQLGLETWRPARVLALWDKKDGAHMLQDGNQVCSRLRATPRDFAAPAAALLHTTPPLLPSHRFFRLLAGTMEPGGQGLLDGLPVPAEGVARRRLPAQTEATAKEEKALQARRTLEVLAERPADKLADPARLLSQIRPVLEALPEDEGAAAVFILGSQFARAGQWPLAQETFLLMADRYPADPLTANAYRWLICHNSSSEVRRRYELKQFVGISQTGFSLPQVPPSGIAPLEEVDPRPGIVAIRGVLQSKDKKDGPEPGVPGRPMIRPRGSDKGREGTAVIRQASVTFLSNQAEVRNWFKGSLAIGKRLAGLGPLYRGDPSIQFCLLAAQRQLGQFQEAQEWCRRFTNGNASPAWRTAAAAELWLAGRQGTPPRPVLPCRQTATRPFLDGNFDDTCWQGLHPVVLQNAVRDTVKEYRTEARFAYDQEFLYIALRCAHPQGQQIAPVKVRPRDADLRPYDRVSILLDLDRDYSTFFRLEVDQRGCVCEDCWGDKSWNPKWFVAIRSSSTSWQIEAAIPLAELTGQPVPVNTAWAVNVVRTLPGRGVQAWSLPADVEPRPEGMGLMLFQEDPTEQAARR